MTPPSARDEHIRLVLARLGRVHQQVRKIQEKEGGPDKPETMMAVWLGGHEPVLLASEQSHATTIGNHLFAVYGRMASRGAPVGCEAEWPLLTNLIRQIAGSYTEASSGCGLSEPSDGLQVGLELDSEAIALLATLLDPADVVQVEQATEMLAGAFDDSLSLTTDEVALLNSLASGTTVEGICENLNVSKRTVHRRLNVVWEKLGARSRSEGLAIATEQGWIA